jgi:hypothetical protein
MKDEPTKMIERRIRLHRGWLNKTPERMVADWHGKIDKYLHEEMLAAFVILADTLRSIGLYCGTRGVVDVYDSKKHGWPDIAGAIECYSWCVRLQIKTHYSWIPRERIARRHGLLTRLPLATGLLCYFVHAGDTSRENDIWSWLQKPLHDDDAMIREWWQSRHFEPFFLNLYAKVRCHEMPFDPGQIDLGVYGGLQEGWADDKSVSATLGEVCDYHLAHMENEDNWGAEFNCPPLDLIPVEVHAINRLRESTGLKRVIVDHPLMCAIPPIVQAATPEELTDKLFYLQRKLDIFFRK